VQDIHFSLMRLGRPLKKVVHVALIPDSQL
jgi:hypothetical protein